MNDDDSFTPQDQSTFIRYETTERNDVETDFFQIDQNYNRYFKIDGGGGLSIFFFLHGYDYKGTRFGLNAINV